MIYDIFKIGENHNALNRIIAADALMVGYVGRDLIAEYNASNVLQHCYVHGPGTDEPILWYEGADR